MDWFDLAVQGTLESSPEPQLESINSSVLSLLYDTTLISVHDYWKNHIYLGVKLSIQLKVTSWRKKNTNILW